MPFASTSAKVADRPALDLTPAGIKAHWARVRVGGLIAAMESTETWSVDSGREDPVAVAQIIQLLADAFNSAPTTGITAAINNNTELTIELMGNLRSGRALALFAWLSDLGPDLPIALFNEARSGRSDMGTLLVERIATLERQHLLSRVFKPERISLILSLLAEAGLTDS